jgi:glyoxylase-like metal-dependent hydrolase (beta-lactamase superfamily II)/rhodanese-related sulfurtransferase
LLEIDVIDTPSLGDRSYLATDGSVALVVDPQRDFDRVLALAQDRGVKITHVFETHIHNDYVTGGLALAREVGAAYHVNAADQVSFDRTPITGGDRLEVGEIEVRVLATPGHTFTHLSYAIEHAGHIHAVFTGGSLLGGSTGRTDLLGPRHSVELARAQQRSAHRLAAELPARTGIYPTHGFGSFCSANENSAGASTIAAELVANPVFTLAEDEFVTEILAGLDVYPAYYAHMAPANAAGPLAPDLAPPRQASRGELRRRINAGEWVVDLRSRVAFAAGHLRGARNFELANNLTTYLGWLITWGAPLSLIAASPADVAAAQRDLVRIGIDRVAAAATGDAGAWADGESLASYPVVGFGEYARARERSQVVLLDVRREIEWKAARIDGALHIPLHELAGRIAEIRAGEIWVHCQSGYRAAVAASLLDAAGRGVVLIGEDFTVAQRDGLASTGAVRA